jgi:UDP-N-acetylglucosamine acyltransferase
MTFYDPHDRFDKSNKIHPTALIHDCVEMGKNNIIGAYTVIGGDGEIRGVSDFKGKVIIGNNNKISELVTIQRPEVQGQCTVIEDNNIIMAHAHIGHDAFIGSFCEICSGVVVGGYSIIHSDVKIKLNATIRNRVVVNGSSLVGMGSVVVKDVPEGQTVKGEVSNSYGNMGKT